jgi:DNA helicase-2/ATP-dependent DNA helicase PcrA
MTVMNATVASGLAEGQTPDGPAAVLDALDPEQREVALAVRGPVCVLAGAGTGKTRAITHRIAYAVHTGVVDPGHVLAVTFTARAAGELRARLRRLGAPGIGLERVQARTFHSAALRQLEHFWPATVGGQAPKVLSAKASLIAEAAREHRIPADAAQLADVATEIEWAKVTQVRPDDYAGEAARAGRKPPLGLDQAGQIYAGYERLRRQRHLIDFEALLELTAAVLAEDRRAAAQVRDRYRYLVVDEYQDVNPLQKLLLDAWLGDRDDLCVVGDPDQAIYSFTGASSRYLTGFGAEFPGATMIRLVRDYRSTPQVVALANRLIAAQDTVAPGAGPPVPGQSVARWATQLVAQRPPGPEPSLTGYPTGQAETDAIAAQVSELIAGGTDPREIAILVRVNAQTQGFEQALREVGVPCQVRGAERFFRRPEVRQAMGLLKAAARSTPAGSLVTEVGNVLAGLGLTESAPVGRGVAAERRASLTVLLELAREVAAEQADATLGSFVAMLAERMEAEDPPMPASVTLATLHAAKGLEWDAVFLPSLAEGVLPISYAQGGEGIAEERRLLYVGVTRARERLALSWPAGAKPSRFLASMRKGTVPAP